MKFKTKIKLVLILGSLIIFSLTTLAQANIMYKAQAGDSLFKIANRFNTTITELSSTNQIKNPNIIYKQQTIKIPDKRLKENNEQTVYTKGPSKLKTALTFDDGPDPTYTPQVLDVLKKYNVKATFFLVGSQVQKYPEITSRIFEEGHTIANHSWSHKDLTKLDDQQLSTEVLATENIIEDTIQKETGLLRPPYGFISQNLIDKMKRMNYKIINWSLDSLDWQAQEKQDVLNKTIPYLDKGAIILFHSAGGRDQSLAPTIKALPIIIEKLKTNDIELTTVDGLLSIAPYRN
ncbi:MAG: polysaccharide deacetylase family protein [Bacillota bacterium]